MSYDPEAVRRRLSEQQIAELALFAPPEPLSHRNDPATSYQAAAAKAPGAETDRVAIVSALDQYGALTAYEVNDVLGWTYPRANRRMSELVRAGLVTRTDDTRPTPGGDSAHIYRLT